jgi:uncharacterized protein (TIGR03067 family)
MPVSCGIVAVALTLLPLAGTDQDRIQGSWQLVSFEKEGKNVPLKGVYVFNGKKFSAIDVKSTGEGTFALDAGKSPKTIDVVNSKNGEGQAKAAFGIYRIENDTLTLCFDLERPTKFDGSGSPALLKFKRSLPK